MATQNARPVLGKGTRGEITSPPCLHTAPMYDADSFSYNHRSFQTAAAEAGFMRFRSGTAQRYIQCALDESGLLSE